MGRGGEGRRGGRGEERGRGRGRERERERSERERGEGEREGGTDRKKVVGGSIKSSTCKEGKVYYVSISFVSSSLLPHSLPHSLPPSLTPSLTLPLPPSLPHSHSLTPSHSHSLPPTLPPPSPPLSSRPCLCPACQPSPSLWSLHVIHASNNLFHSRIFQTYFSR